MKKAFKLITLICVVASMFAMSSCKKSQEDLIVGTWKLTAIDSEPQNPFALFLVGSTFAFNADKTMTATVSIFGQTEVSNGTYTINDGKLVMTIDGEALAAEIKTLDKKNLSIFLEETDEDEDGQPMTIKMTWNFERQ